MNPPKFYQAMMEATTASGFNMASDPLTCSFLATLAAAKPSGRFLELGTGTGLSTSWILQGMTADARLVSIDNTSEYLSIANRFLKEDPRVELVLTDGDEWILNNTHLTFDYIFADTWPGKYHLLDEVINMLNPGGLYIIDDMLPQPNWPEGHEAKAAALAQHLLGRDDLIVTQMNWATGIMLGVKR